MDAPAQAEHIARDAAGKTLPEYEADDFLRSAVGGQFENIRPCAIRGRRGAAGGRDRRATIPA